MGLWNPQGVSIGGLLLGAEPPPPGYSVAWVLSPWHLSMRAHSWFGL